MTHQRKRKYIEEKINVGHANSPRNNDARRVTHGFFVVLNDLFISNGREIMLKCVAKIIINIFFLCSSSFFVYSISQECMHIA